MKMNDTRASRTWNMLEADAVYDAESNSALSVNVSLMQFSGVCVVGMHEMTQPRNLGAPICSLQGRNIRNNLPVYFDGRWEVRWFHSTEEVR